MIMIEAINVSEIHRCVFMKRLGSIPSILSNEYFAQVPWKPGMEHKVYMSKLFYIFTCIET